MQHENDTPKPEDSPKQETGEGCQKRLVRRDLVWHPGPANGGGGTAQDQRPEAKHSWWWDGDLLLILVELQSEDFVRLVRVNADGDLLCFQDPDTEDDVGFSADDISWWAKVMDSLPTNDKILP